MTLAPPHLYHHEMRHLLLLASIAIAALGVGCTDDADGTGGTSSTGMSGPSGPAGPGSGGKTTGMDPGPDGATLTWDPNTEADLAGYKVYHSETSQMYTLGTPEATIPVGTQTYVVTKLAKGRHYFAVTAYDTAGNESALSMEVYKDIP